MMLFGEQLLNNEDVGVNPQVSERECSKKYALSSHLCLADSKWVDIGASWNSCDIKCCKLMLRQ
ncbi:hypothetical protein CY35_08G131500 [Sphagnum magellanicum]|nr:hypothetical protein CY35_08G131500 [Sphagnum magellanicum]